MSLRQEACPIPVLHQRDNLLRNGAVVLQRVLLYLERDEQSLHILTGKEPVEGRSQRSLPLIRFFPLGPVPYSHPD